MPELPEVETIRRGLEAKIVGCQIVDVEVRVPRLFIGDVTQVIGAKVVTLERRGKLLVIALDNGLYLTAHLKMTGQLVWQGADQEAVIGGHPEKQYLEPLPHKHTHIIFSFADGAHLYYNDLRKFGRISVVSKSDLLADNFVASLGPDPLTTAFNQEYLADQLQQHAKQPVKSFLLDQSNIAGIGNIYADESLFRAAILPGRLCGSLSTGENNNLFHGIQETLELALRHGGSTARDYVNAVGEKGTFLEIANVYHRTGMDCHRCGGKIVKKKIGGRSSHYCAGCQR